MHKYDDDFEFEYWAALADNDPAAFEDARRAVIDSLIEAAPQDSRRRLVGLQWQVDTIRERAHNPLKACIDISGMMWDTMLGADGLVEYLEELAGRRPLRERNRQPAEVLPLRQDARRN
ncbi:MAG: DUF3135 domain-containing protein [Gammaproteobacteria bacterium]